MKIYTKRLVQGDDLKKEIEKLCSLNNIKAGVILSSVGSLNVLSIRVAGATQISEIHEKMEIISLNGTVSYERVHLHISASKVTGEVIGGHLIYNTVIDTTCELVIMEIDDREFGKQYDEKTKFYELLIKE